MSTNPSDSANQARRGQGHVLITGGSNGIGAALALAYANAGWLVSLQGRDATRLESVARACKEAGGEALTGQLDVRDRATLGSWIAAQDDARPIDLLIANAGIAGLAATGRDDASETARRIMEVNVLGLVDTVQAILPRFQARSSGHLALMASLAAFRGYAQAPAYAASKAAIHIYGQGLRARLRAEGIAVSTIYPGFVATDLTRDNPFPMPFLMSAERAAAIIKDGLERRRTRIAFPRRTLALAKLGAMLPDWLVDRLTAGSGSKE